MIYHILPHDIFMMNQKDLYPSFSSPIYYGGKSSKCRKRKK